jgi:uncharacterized protein YqeY
MSIMERLKRDMVQATKAREAGRLGVIRLVRSEAKNREIELRRELKDEDVVEVLSRLAKGCREAVAQFEGGGRPDLVEQEKAKLSVIDEYLPEQLSEDEIAAVIDEAIAEVGAEGPRGTGLVMKTIMPKLKGRADGKMVKDLVQSKLTEPAES